MSEKKFTSMSKVRMECPHCGKDCWHDDYREIIAEAAVFDGLEKDIEVPWTCWNCNKDFRVTMSFGICVRTVR